MNLLPEVAITPNTIHHMDLFRLCNAMGDASVDMILCDLPYGVLDCKWDSIIPIEPMWAEFKRIIKPKGAVVLTATEPFASRLRMSNLEMYKYDWVWDKTLSGNFLTASYAPLKIHELILVFGDNIKYIPQMTTGKSRIKGGGKSNLWSLVKSKTISDSYYPKSIIIVPNTNRDVQHPTQKPVKLFEYLILTYTQPNDLVFDPCVGSGTTALAAKRTDRRYICGDSDAGYVNIARNRLGHTLTFEDKELKNGETQLSLF